MEANSFKNAKVFRAMAMSQSQKASRADIFPKTKVFSSAP
jgi:hypothetical protein